MKGIAMEHIAQQPFSLKRKVMEVYDLFDEHPLFKWQWTVVDVAIIAFLVIH
jgi:hypothetical protein